MSQNRMGGLTRRELLRRGAMTGGAAALAWGCAPVAPIGQPSASPQVGGTLTYGSAQGLLNLDPHPTSSSPFIVHHMIFDTLVFRDDAGNLVPKLATSWKTLDDKTWEFKLRSGVTFHNGEPLDAAAVKFSLERFIDPKQKAVAASRLSEVSRIEAVDDLTVRIYTKNPFPVLLLGLHWGFIVPPKYTTENLARFIREPSGTGPFKFVEFVEGDHLTVVANEKYFLGRPKLDKVIYKIIPDDASRLAGLKAGELDIDQNLPIDAVDDLAKDPNLYVLQAQSEAGLLFFFDTVRPSPVTNLKVRQALNLAVDKDEINRTLLRGKLKPLAGQLITEGILGFNPAVKAVPYNPERAKLLLAEAGYPNGFDTVLNGPVGKYVADRDILTAVASQLAKVGVRAKVNVQEPAVHSAKVSSNENGPMFLVAYFSNGDPALAMQAFLSTKSPGWYYNDKVLDAPIAAAAQTIDTKKREQLYFEAAQYASDQAMALWLFQPAQFYGLRKRVANFAARGDDIPNIYPVAFKP